MGTQTDREAGTADLAAGPPATTTTGVRHIGWVLLVLSAAGPFLVRLALRWFGRAGGLVAEGVIGVLLARALMMVRGGALGRLQRLPRALLVLECGADLAAALIGGWTWLWQPFNVRTGATHPAGPRRAERLSRLAVWATFTLHTIRLGIYLSPGRGRRVDQ